MVDVVGLYSGIRPFKGATEPTFFEMHPGGNVFRNKNNNVRKPARDIYTPLPVSTDQFTPILQTKSLHGVLPCKGQPEAIKYGRIDSSLTEGMYPQQGYARHQKKGLAYDSNKPMDLKIMPIAGFYNTQLVNTLGNLK